MRILHTFDFFSPHGGGTVEVVYKLTQALAGRGHEVVVYTSDYKLDRAYIDSLPEVDIYPFHCVSAAGNFFYTPSLAPAVKENLKGFDVIHMHCFRSYQNIVVRRYALEYSVPYIMDSHGSLPRVAAGESGYKWLLRWLFDVAFGNRVLRDAAKVIVQNDFAVRENRGFGVEDGRMALVPLFFPVEEYADLPPTGEFRERYGLSGKAVIMSLGRIHRIKGLDFLVESFSELAKTRQDVILVIVGPDDGYLDTLKIIAATLELTSKIIFTGYLGGRDKLAALVDADVVVQPSRYEQAAWAPIESVLCGTPAIVSADSGSGEDVRRIDAGYLVEYGDKDQMVRTIQDILDNPAAAGEKTARAREYITNNLRFSDRVEDYEKLYRECTDENLPTGREK